MTALNPVAGRPDGRPAHVSRWAETMIRRSYRGKRYPKLPNVLRVLVDGQACGSVERDGTTWVAEVHGLRPSTPTTHDSAQTALDAVLRSGWARQLGYRRATSRIVWTDAAAGFVERAAKGGAR